jgi:hypothetical protein
MFARCQLQIWEPRLASETDEHAATNSCLALTKCLMTHPGAGRRLADGAHQSFSLRRLGRFLRGMADSASVKSLQLSSPTLARTEQRQLPWERDRDSGAITNFRMRVLPPRHLMFVSADVKGCA